MATITQDRLVDSYIDRHLSSSLTDAEYRVVRFVYQRTIKFGKTHEIIPLRHLLSGVTDREGNLIHAGLPYSASTIRRALRGLFSRQIILKFEKKGHAPSIGLGFLDRFEDQNYMQIAPKGGHSCEQGGWSRVTGGSGHSCEHPINRENITMRKVTAGNAVPASLVGLGVSSSAKTKEAREKRKLKKTATAYETVFSDAWRSVYDDRGPTRWTVADLGIIKNALARLPASVDRAKFIEAIVFGWDQIMKSRFGWMKNRPSRPAVRFIARHVDVLYDAYSSGDDDPNKPIKAKYVSPADDKALKEKEAEIRNLKKKLDNLTKIVRDGETSARRIRLKKTRTRLATRPITFDDTLPEYD